MANSNNELKQAHQAIQKAFSEYLIEVKAIKQDYHSRIRDISVSVQNAKIDTLRKDLNK